MNKFLIYTKYFYFIILFLLFQNYTLFCYEAGRNTYLDYEKIDKEIKQQRQELETIKDSKKRIAEYITTIEDKLLLIRKSIAQLNIEQKKLQDDIYKIKEDLNTLKFRLDSYKEDIIQNNIYILNNSHMLKVKALLFTNDYHQILKNLDIIDYMNDFAYQMTLKYEETKRDYEGKLSELNLKRKKLLDIKNNKNNMLVDYKDEKIKYEHSLAILNEDTTLKKRYIEVLEQRKDEIKKKINQIVESDDAVNSSNMLAMKGKLSWPVVGKLIKDKVNKGILYNNGIRITVENNSEVKAVYKGRVKYINWIKGFGNIVIISHSNDFYTVYANIDLIGVQMDEVVDTNETIGKVNIEGSIDNPYIYFEIRRKNKPLDPLEWLKKEA